MYTKRLSNILSKLIDGYFRYQSAYSHFSRFLKSISGLEENRVSWQILHVVIFTNILFYSGEFYHELNNPPALLHHREKLPPSRHSLSFLNKILYTHTFNFSSYVTSLLGSRYHFFHAGDCPIQIPSL